MDLVKIQEMVKSFTVDKNISTNVEVRIIDLVSEVGELCKEILKGTNYGKNNFNNTIDWESEIGDVLFSLICIANETDTDLEKSLFRVLKKYEERFNLKEDIGS